MSLDFVFFFNCIMMGIGLAVDAFSVSLANGLNDPKMKVRKMCGIAGVFGIFQGVMPLIGWFCVHTFVKYFSSFEKFIPWIALILLGFIGGKMLIEGIKNKECAAEAPCIGICGLLVQGIATSIDALSVGFTIAEYDFYSALISSLIIALVTFITCFAGVEIGKRAGVKLAGKAGILGGVILILIGIEIFVSNMIG